MTEDRKQASLKFMRVICVIMLASLVIWCGCKKEPSGQAGTGAEQPGPSSESPDVEAEPSAGDKTSLNEIISAARTWYASFTSWFGKSAPDFTLTDITGKEHTLSDYRGKDVMVIFWAIRCPPCRREVPDFIELRNTVGEDKLAMLAISPESASLLERFVAQQRINYTVLSNPATLPMPYSLVQYVPSTFFIDPQGNIKLATTGMIPLGDIKAILRAE
jgi:peroxiredoxin